jgi:hypothetical protein
MQIVVLPHVIEQKLKVDERQEVIDFINDLISDTSTVLKNDIIEILEERFEKKLSMELSSLKLALMERISSSAEQLNEKITGIEIQVNERITRSEAALNERITKTEAALNERITKTEAALNERITRVEAVLSEKITTGSEKLKTELVEKIVNSKAETIKWMFIFWIGNVITVIGGIIGILKIAKVF